MSLSRFGNHLLLPVCIMIVLATPAGQAGRIYKWTDKEGNTVYSQTPPPPGIRAERISGAPPPPEDPDKAMKELRERTEGFAERREDRLTLEKEGKEALEKKKQLDKVCEQLRKNLELLQNNTRVREHPEGKAPVIITEEQRQERIKSTQKRIQDECVNNDQKL